MARTTVARRPEKIQFNIRVDGEVLARFRDYCRRNGLDPQGQVVLFMRKVLDTEFDFQERLWSALKEKRSWAPRPRGVRRTGGRAPRGAGVASCPVPRCGRARRREGSRRPLRPLRRGA